MVNSFSMYTTLGKKKKESGSMPINLPTKPLSRNDEKQHSESWVHNRSAFYSSKAGASSLSKYQHQILMD